jgi:coenzyme F420 biosynthesis associated uncharacterized protein
MRVDAIDWALAQRVGELVAGNPPDLDVQAVGVGALTRTFAEQVSAYTGLELAAELPALEVVDRPSWIAANLNSMRPLLEPLAKQNTKPRRTFGPQAPLTHAMRAASGLMLGAQVGAVTGVLSQRVLGQYDIELLNPSPSPRLLLVAPNLGQTARTLNVNRDDLTSWVAIHEVTHAVQFSGAPWLQGHLAGLMQQLIAKMQVNVSGADVLKGLVGTDPRSLLARLRRGEVLRLTVGEARWELVERLQSTMSLIEGHAEHVMDAVGADVLPSLSELRDAMTKRRTTRGLPWRVLERLLGIELKMRQYEVGRRFCDLVVEQRGAQALTRAFNSAEDLPTAAELEHPGLWLTRVDP